jgi:hypothetical protein
VDGDLILLLRQVDNFSIASTNSVHCEKVRKDIEDRMQNPLNDLDVIKRFNGIGILQARDFVTISCISYIDKIVSHHGWQHKVASTQPIPMRADSESLRKLELSKGPDDPAGTHMGFRYRQAIGELIFRHYRRLYRHIIPNHQALSVLGTAIQSPLPSGQTNIYIFECDTSARPHVLVH